VEQRTASLQEATNLLKEAQRIGQMGHWEWDIPGGTLRWSEEVYRLFGQSPEMLPPSYDAFLQAVHPDDRDKVVTAVEQALIQGSYQISHRVLWPDGSIRLMQEMGRVTYGEDDRPLRMLGTVQDITEAQRLQQQLWDMAHHDTLTGLPNRNLLFDHLKQAIALAQRQEGALAVALLDLDRFKEANDSLGHAAGDRLLVEVANRLRNAVRQSDVVARFAGDEFVAIFPAVGTPEQVGVILDKVLASLEAPCQLNGTEWRISASIGVAFYPRDGQDAEALLQAADEAMYAVKQAGRNGYRTYSATQQ
jgi:diguanylate cyclase (GGDEF)-like protein/PAS domain S-box-containing protein